MDIQHYLIAASAVLGAIILVYLFGYWGSSKKLIKSFNVLPNIPSFEADQFYFLPGYDLHLKLKASLQIDKDDSGTIKQVQISDLYMEPTIIVVPDSTSLIGVQYLSNIFTDNDFSITKNIDGLLSNTSFKSDDKIGNIISSLITTSKIKDADLAAAQGENLTSTTIEVEETFTIYCYQIKQGTTEIRWKVPLLQNDQTIYYPLDFTIQTPFNPININLDEYPGLFTRSNSLQNFSIFSEKNEYKFSIIAPNLEQIIKVPVRKPFFNKIESTPTFTNGILLDNKLSKPSEVEGFATIPINILKAIVSIPAQIFQFKITQIKDSTHFEKELKLLKDAKGISEKEQKTIAELEKKIKDLEQRITPNH